MSALRVEALGDANAAAWEALFDRAGSTCFCRWWHFEGKKNDWLARCAIEPETNRIEAALAIAAHAPGAQGLVAIDGTSGACIGWMKITPRASVPKLRGLGVYRALDLGADEGIWSIGCFLVDPNRRREGMAGALLDAAPAFVRERGGRAIEAYPRHMHEAAHQTLHDEEVLMGPESLFAARGFLHVAEGATTPMYPVYRLALV